MKAARFEGGERIVVADCAEPSAGPGEVVLDVRACSLCGSELRVWRSGWPTTPGHEIVGVVATPGHPLAGRRCLVYIPAFCGACGRCAAGDTHLCERAELVGWQRPGGYAERIAVPQQCLLPVPDDVPSALATLLLDTIGTAAHGVRLAQRLSPAGPVLVVGGGPIGLGAVLVAQGLGLPEVWLAEPRAERMRIGCSLGAHAAEPGERAPRFALVLEASGSHAGRQRALEQVAPGGVVVFLGESDTWQIEENRAVRRKDFFIARSFYFPLREYEQNLQLLRGDRERFARLVDAAVPLQQLPELFAQFARGERIKPQVAFAA